MVLTFKKKTPTKEKPQKTKNHIKNNQKNKKEKENTKMFYLPPTLNC